ncbi:hypothetical protein KP509_01G104600 [Ceratopteris richardii]|uniref:DUF1995 domain-containing protein n=1 Tax=Ceratopteris richardii TaxID=49495 RepID=A0A8T2VJG8_CERRI|nr:hypothetical protein KP509_01G104600 [Ceratopteris richardii]
MALCASVYPRLEVNCIVQTVSGLRPPLPVPRLHANRSTSFVSARASISAVTARVPNPQTIEEVCQQASDAVKRASQDGKSRQLLQILLPVDQRQFNYLDTEPRDYPCSIRDEFIACCKLTTSILKGLGDTDRNDEVLVKRIGELENEMDPVAALYPSDKSIVAVVFPISETLKQIKSIVKDNERRTTLIVNPQWRSSGQIISDFGFGPWRRQAEEFLNSFESTYILLEQRIGEASNVVAGGAGGVVRLLKCFPEDWHVYLMAGDGSSDLIGCQAQQPTYKELEVLVAEARKTIPWKQYPRMLGGSEPAPPPLPKSLSGPLDDDAIEQMDKMELRRALIALNLPTSGRLDTLRQRLKEAQQKRTP